MHYPIGMCYEVGARVTYCAGIYRVHATVEALGKTLLVRFRTPLHAAQETKRVAVHKLALGWARDEIRWDGESPQLADVGPL